MSLNLWMCLLIVRLPPAGTKACLPQLTLAIQKKVRNQPKRVAEVKHQDDHGKGLPEYSGKDPWKHKPLPGWFWSYGGLRLSKEGSQAWAVGL